jgi:competence protein ComEC
MQFWSTKPILKILIPFVAGIILYPCLDLAVMLALTATVFLLLFTRRFLKKYLQYRLQYIYGALIHMLFVSAGYLDMHFHDIKMDPRWFANGKAEIQVIASVEGAVKKKDRHYSSTINILYIQNKSRWQPATGNLLVYFPLDIDSPHHGDIFYINTKILPVPPPKKSSTFDYAAFLALRNIYHKAYPELKDIQKLDHIRHAVSLYNSTNQLRKKILGILDRYISGPGENGLAKALLIGYRDNLEREIVTAYTNTGVIHVIAISGLHLGLLYSLMAWLLKFPSRIKSLHLFRCLFIAAFLWIFSILCGASPSVLRSALMFTCLLAGETLQKENYTANALAASAFILLCFDPKLIMDIGFQLSYAAVGSLMIYNRYISRIYSPRNLSISFAWNSISTSISAQVLTTPLILFHFHQFPVLFILANLIAVPLSGIILILLIFLCLLSSFPLVASPLAWITNWLCFEMNTQISRLNRVSFAVITDIKTGLADSILLYACIVFASFWLSLKKPAAALALLFVMLIWLSISRNWPRMLGGFVDNIGYPDYQ